MRSFVALELPETFADETAALARQLSAPVRGRFIPRESYHVTLAFLGEIGEASARDAVSALEDAALAAAPATLRPEGLGTFGKPVDATLWLGLTDDPALLALAAGVRRALDDYVVAYERKAFLPHITLARRARMPRGRLPELVFPAPAEASRITLFRSILEPTGAVYKPLYSVELGEGRADGR